MLNSKIKLISLCSIALVTSPGFAKNISDNVLSAPQPYVNDIGNVEISFQTVNNYNPVDAYGPSKYHGTMILNAAFSNNSNNPVNVSCTGKVFSRVCTGGDITTCAWTDEAGTAILNFSSTVTSGNNAVVTFASDPVLQTNSSGWGLEVYSKAGDDMISCKITDEKTGAFVYKKYFVPVA